MSQISPPIRILAVCAIGFLAAWMVFLRPGEPAVEPPAATPAASTAAQPAPAASTTGAAARPATAAAAAPGDPTATATAGMPRRVRAAVANRRVLALLFWNRRAADDRAVHRELRRVQGHFSNVVFHTAPVKDIARYGAITRGVEVQQSPTVVVVDRARRAEALVGYSDHDAIRQSIDDALRAAKKR